LRGARDRRADASAKRENGGFTPPACWLCQQAPPWSTLSKMKPDFNINFKGPPVVPATRDAGRVRPGREYIRLHHRRATGNGHAPNRLRATPHARHLSGLAKMPRNSTRYSVGHPSLHRPAP